MNPEIKAKWIEALRSGHYQQGKKVLRSFDNKYCCLGVLCDLYAEETIGAWGPMIDAYISNGATLSNTKGYAMGVDLRAGVLPREVMSWADINISGNYMDDEMARSLTSDNDNGKTFTEIADIIKEKF